MAEERTANNKPEKANVEEKIITEHYEDLVSSYLDLMMTVPKNPYSEMVIEKKLARIGKELLPKNDEKDKLSDNEIEAKPANYNVEIKERKIGSESKTIYSISSSDAGTVESAAEQLDYLINKFENQQYKNVSDELFKINSDILHRLVEKKIIPDFKPKIKDIIDILIEKNYNIQKEKK